LRFLAQILRFLVQILRFALFCVILRILRLLVRPYVKPYFDAILQNGYQAYTSILNKMTITSENQEEILENFSSEQNIVEDSPISNAPPLDDPQSTISS